MTVSLLVTISDPWSFSDENGGASFSATVIERGEGGWLLKAVRNLTIGGVAFRYFACRSRHEGKELEALTEGKPVSCNLIGVPDEKISEAFSYDWWRGGGGAIGSIKLA